MSDIATPDVAAVPAARQHTADELIDAWIGLGSRAGKLLRDTESPNFAQRVQAIDHELLELVDSNTDGSLLLLIQTVSAAPTSCTSSASATSCGSTRCASTTRRRPAPYRNWRPSCRSRAWCSVPTSSPRA